MEIDQEYPVFRRADLATGILAGRVAIFGTDRVRVRVSIIGYEYACTGRVAEMFDSHTPTPDLVAYYYKQ